MIMDSDRTRKMGTDCWKRGSEAAAKQDWDFAIQMYGQAVAFVADNLAFRQTLRSAEQKKYGDNKSGAKMATMKLLPVRARIKKAAGKAEWDAVDKAAEEGLAINPWDARINSSLGEACRKRGYTDVAIFCYQMKNEAITKKRLPVGNGFKNLIRSTAKHGRNSVRWMPRRRWIVVGTKRRKTRAR